MKNLTTIVKKHIVYIFTICFFYILLRYYNVSCPILAFLGVPCPTCGVTRAMIALFTLNFKNYLHYHPLAIPLIIAVCLMLHARFLKRKKLVYTFVLFVLILNFIFYIYRYDRLFEL